MKKGLFLAVIVVCMVIVALFGGTLINGDREPSDNGVEVISRVEEDNLPSIIAKNINSENELLKDSKATRDTITLSTYENALMNFLEVNELPNGKVEEIANPEYDMSENKFAILDIDGDGKKELVLALVNLPMASMRTIIYKYDVDANEIKEEFVEFPEMTIYNNGIIEVKASHNQGMAGEAFWPYTLYKYNSKLDTYDRIALVDAWDKSLTDTVEGEKFPDDIDKDGDGIIYYIIPDGNYELKKAVDLAEYDNWRKEYIDETTENIEVEYQTLTKDNALNILSNRVVMTSIKGTTESFELDRLKLAITNVKEMKIISKTDGTGEWDEKMYVVYPGAKVHIQDVDMYVYDDETLNSYFQFYFNNENNEEHKEKILLGMKDIEITKNLVGVISENEAIVTFEISK